MYFKISLPNKAYVAEGSSLAAVVWYFAEAYEGIDDADDKTNSENSYFEVKPLTEDLTVKGVPYEIALFNEIISLIKSGECDDDNPEDWIMILEADRGKRNEIL